MKSNNRSRPLGTLFALLAMLFAMQANADPCHPSKEIKLKAGKYHLELKDKHPICILKDSVTNPQFFTIKIKPQGNPAPTIEDDVVTVTEKDGEPPSPLTITKEDDTVNDEVRVKIALKAGKSIKINEDYDYYIEVAGIGVLDPRVRVVDNETSLQNSQLEAINELLVEEFGVFVTGEGMIQSNYKSE